MVKRYAKKPIIIEAIKWDGFNIEEVLRFSDKCYLINGKNMKIHTLEGVMNASVGDFIIRGIQGEYYACKPDIFLETYDSLEK